MKPCHPIGEQVVGPIVFAQAISSRIQQVGIAVPFGDCPFRRGNRSGSLWFEKPVTDCTLLNVPAV